MDFAPNNSGDNPFPVEFIDPTNGKLRWKNEDWDPALRFWTLGWDPNLTEWLKDQNPALSSIQAAREFAQQHAKWRFGTDAALKGRGWLAQVHLDWQTMPLYVDREIKYLFMLMEDDRDRYLPEANAQADGLPGYITHMLWMDSERRPWTMELIRCGLAIGNLVYMNYKEQFRRVRPSFIAPGLVPPFGPPRHPSFPSGHSFLGHFIALLLLEIPQVAARYGEPPAASAALGSPRSKATLAEVMNVGHALDTGHVFKGPLLWLAARLAVGRERIGVHYPSDSAASRCLAGALWALLVAGINNTTMANTTPPGAANQVTPADLIDCPSLAKVLLMAKAEWA